MVAIETTAEQRIYMVSRTAELGRRYGELTEATKTLERQRANHERELRDYQQTLAAQLSRTSPIGFARRPFFFQPLLANASRFRVQHTRSSARRRGLNSLNER